MCTLDGIRNVLNAVAQQQEQAGGPKVSSIHSSNAPFLLCDATGLHLAVIHAHNSPAETLSSM
jgi:hypothetical protein